MKTLLYKPLFINPLAYYVFPNINGRLEPKTGSGKEPAIFVGNIEVKTIAYGDTSKKQYFYNTNEIDLSAFSGSLIRISLYTSRGNVVLGEWNLDVIEEEPGDYIDPKVLDSLCGVWIMDQNTNESESRNIIKNKIADRGGDLELLNFAYKANSGYNGYPEDFTSWRNSKHLQVEYSTDGSKFKITSENIKDWWLIVPNSGISNSFKVKITNCHFPIVWRYTDDGNTYKDITISEDGIYNLPQSIINNEGVVNRCCFGSGTQRNDYTGLTIEQLPLYEGALVTDGKDDMIVSQKTVQEMGITDEITVVSMIHQINVYNSAANVSYTNYIRNDSGYIRNNVSNADKTGIYGYSYKNTGTVINKILGDKNDYTVEGNLAGIDSTFSIIGRNDGLYLSEAAIYWTFIANKVLTTDEINQIIAYFKLDKYVTPQVIYDVKRQGLSNDTPDSDWYLKDFSGNGHDMQLYNYAKKGNSGIGKYAEDFTSWSKTSSLNLTSSGFTIKSVNDFNNANWILWSYLNTSPKSFKIRVKGSPNNSLLIYRYQKDGSTIIEDIVLNKDGVYELPASIYVQNGNGFRINIMDKSDLEKYIGLSIEQIPDYEGALVSDGKDDYGHADNLPIFKDYTVAIDRAWINLVGARAECLSTKNSDPDWGAFNFELSESISRNTFSFGGTNQVSIDVNRKISYQSKYSYNGTTIGVGDKVDGKDLFLFRSRSAFPYYAEAAVWSYLLFSYTLSEFLLERQLKKYKLGTLYPNMVEFRPIIKSNVEYSEVGYLNYTHNLAAIKSGDYVNIGDTIAARIVLNNTLDEIVNAKVNGQECEVVNVSPRVFDCKFIITSKSPQKIDITIDEYIRFEDIVQPYPEIWTITQNGNKVSWGDKLKVGSEFGYNSKVNLLSGLYSTANSYYNGKVVKTGDVLKVEKQMTFACNKRWKLNTTEPHAIYSPQKLNIPNSSLKILGYVPDLTGKGNHGKLNNFAYTEDSGVAADGSIKFDGTDDYITIPTLAHGGKCVMMKVNWNKDGLMLYDQRKDNNPNAFAIYIPIFNNENSIAYSSRNDGKTYIDGVLNTFVKGSQLKDVTHNITITNSNSNNDNTVSPAIGSNAKYNTFYAQMSLYEFMLFPEIPSEDEIKKLNDVMGIENNIEVS